MMHLCTTVDIILMGFLCISSTVRTVCRCFYKQQSKMTELDICLCLITCILLCCLLGLKCDFDIQKVNVRTRRRSLGDCGSLFATCCSTPPPVPHWYDGRMQRKECSASSKLRKLRKSGVTGRRMAK